MKSIVELRFRSSMLVILAVGWLALAEARAQNLIWTGEASSSFNDGGNWKPVGQGPPGVGDSAVFDTLGGLVTLTAGTTQVDQLVIQGTTTTLTRAPGANLSVLELLRNDSQNESLIVGRFGGDNAGLTLQDITVLGSWATVGREFNATGSMLVDADSSLNLTHDLHIGQAGNGTFTVQAGGEAVNSNGVLGRFSTASGTATVTGAGSTWTNSGTLSVGGQGTGTLAVADGGTVSNTTGVIAFNANSTGSATVTGVGSTWVNSGQLLVGADGTGTLSITEGGSVSNTSSTIANNLNAEGTATVSGMGSTWTNSGSLTVGGSGTGSFTVTDGGSVSNTSGTLAFNSGSTGSATVNGVGSTWSNAGNLQVGEAGMGTLTVSEGGSVSSVLSAIGLRSGSIGEATITGADSMWTNSSSLRVGQDGSGTMTISNGGFVSSSSGFVGFGLGSAGAATVTGTGSTWTIGTSLNIGNAGMGTLMIADGGIVSSGALGIGSNQSAVGIVTVTGVGSSWGHSNLTVGDGGTGTLIVAEGGSITSQSSVIGHFPSSDGAVTVTGQGSNWAINNILRVGRSGTGTLKIEDGAIVTGSGSFLGYTGGSTGNVIVTGAGSLWADSGTASVGRNGMATLRIEAGGSVSNMNGVIGAGLGSQGFATVTDSGSTWTNSASLTVGNAGAGTLAVADGGKVVVGQSLNIGSLGLVSLDGGTIDLGALNLHGGTFNWTAGTLRGRNDLNVADLGVFDGLVINQEKLLNVDGTTSIGSGLSLTLDGGTVRSGTLAGPGRFHFDAGMLHITGASGFSIADPVIGGALVLDSAKNLLVDQTLTVGTGSALLLNGGGLQSGALAIDGGLIGGTSPLDLDQTGGLTGRGTVATRVVGSPGSTITATGTLTLGSLSSPDGFNLGGTLLVGSHTVALHDAGWAQLGLLTSLSEAGSLRTFHGAALGLDGILTASGNALIDGAFRNNGLVQGPTGDSWLTFIDDVSGSGNYTGNILFSDGFNPGNSTAIVSFENLAFDSTAALNIELGGLLPGLGYDQLQIAGDVDLGNALLNVGLINGFQLDLNQQFTILDVGGSLTGQFAGLLEGWQVGSFDGIDLFISYSGGSGNSVVLFTPVPEPSSLLMLSLIALPSVARARRKQFVQSR